MDILYSISIYKDQRNKQAQSRSKNTKKKTPSHCPGDKKKMCITQIARPLMLFDAYRHCTIILYAWHTILQQDLIRNTHLKYSQEKCLIQFFAYRTVYAISISSVTIYWAKMTIYT